MNILFVLSDQHNARCLGVEGHPLAKTPHMDELACDGVRFTSAYTQNPICTPSRVSILSGQYTHNHGYYGLCGPTPVRLPDFLGHFRRHGYRTGYVGNMHLPNDPRAWLADSLDAARVCNDNSSPACRSDYFAYLHERGLRDLEDSVRLPEFPGAMQHEGRPSNLPFEHSVEAWCAREAMAFMEQTSPSQPFLLHVALPRPHQCYTPAREFWDLYPDDLPLPPFLLDASASAQRPPHFQDEVRNWRRDMKWLIEPKTFDAAARRIWRGYLGLISQTDHALGMMIDYLRQTGRDKDTIIIYGSDHGAYTGLYGLMEKAPGICADAVCRVPLIWHTPGRDPGISNHLVQNIDIGPTLASLCHVPAMDWVDGRDISSLLRGSTEPVHDLVATENAWSKAIRVGPWRFVHYVDGMFGGQDIGELYNLNDDPNELCNLYHESAHQPRVHEMRRLLLDWLIRTTRVSSFWPAMDNPRGARIERYPLAADGKESVADNPAVRTLPGVIKYL